MTRRKSIETVARPVLSWEEFKESFLTHCRMRRELRAMQPVDNDDEEIEIAVV